MLGPSGLDATGWKRLCTSFHAHSNSLCESIVTLTRCLATEYVDPKGIEAFVACRLIALDKCPGIRPIGIGEVIWRITCKAIALVAKSDILEAVGVSQLCAGHESGCEAALHAMHDPFLKPSK